MHRIIIIALLAVLLPLCVLNCGKEFSPAETAEEFVRRASLGDYKGAEELVSERCIVFFRENQEGDEWSVLGGELDEIVSEERKKESLANLAKMHFTEGEVDNDKAIVYVTHEDYPGQRHTIILVREKGSWKVDLENSSLITAARESALQKTCFANMRTVISMSNVYAAANEGVYPASWEDVLPDYLEEIPVCPLDGSEYHVEWHADAPPTVECPNHGKPEPADL